MPARLKPKNISNTVLKAAQNRRGSRPNLANRQGGDLVLASYNVHKCVGTDKIFDPSRIINVIHEINPDIIALQEADKRFGDRVGLLDEHKLYEQTGLRPIPLSPMSAGGMGWHGNVILSRTGIIERVQQLRLPGMEPRGALSVEFALKNGPLRLIAAHFGLLKVSRAKQAETILSLIEKNPDIPTIMVGDLNEWRLGKNSSLTNLSPVFDLALGAVPSFPSRFPILALDRIMAYPQNLIASIESHNTPIARIASDHLPIKAKIDLKDMASLAKSDDQADA